MADRFVIALALFVSILLLGILGSSANTIVLREIEEQRLDSVTAQLRSHIETDLRIGLALADNDDAQRLLEDLAAHTPELDSIEIDSDQGAVLFASDRVLRGQPVPPAWLDAMRVNPSSWHATRGGSHSAAMALRDASGEVVGYLVWTHQESEEDATPLLGSTLWIAIAIALAALLAPRIVERFAGSSTAAESIERAMTGAEAAGQALEHASNDAHRLAGIES